MHVHYKDLIYLHDAAFSQEIMCASFLLLMITFFAQRFGNLDILSFTQSSLYTFVDIKRSSVFDISFLPSLKYFHLALIAVKE